MKLFKKKPVIVQATQWFKMGDHPEVLNYHEAWDKGYRHHNPALVGLASVRNGYNGKGLIQTLEGWHEVTPGDWIITGVKGEHYPCKPDIFDLTYEEVSSENTAEGIGTDRKYLFTVSINDSMVEWKYPFLLSGSTSIHDVAECISEHFKVDFPEAVMVSKTDIPTSKENTQMNAREEARRQAEVMLAFEEGKEIEFNRIGCANDNWQITESPSWNWSEFDYRVAQPKKRKVEKWQWVIEYEDNRRYQWITIGFYAYKSEVEADNPGCIVIQRADWTRIEVEE